MTSEPSKLCRDCQTSKLITEFNKNKASVDGLQNRCRSCQSLRRHDWYEKNREKEIAKSAAWVKANPEKARAKDRRRAIARPRRTSARAAEWRKKNPQAAAAFSRSWKSANQDKVRASERRRYKDDPNKDLARQHRRRLRIKSSGGTFTHQDILSLYERQKGCCAACRKSLAHGYQRDHIVPLALGGSNDIRNIQLLCPRCNAKKGGEASRKIHAGNGPADIAVDLPHN